MRICYLADARSIHSHKWVTAIAESGQEVSWLSLTPFHETPSGVACYRLRPGGLNPLGVLTSAIHARRLVSRLQPDIVHAHYLGSYGLLGFLLGRRPLVATAWGSEILYGARSQIKRPPIKAILHAADLITCDGDNVRMALADLGVAMDRVRTVYVGVDIDQFCPDPDRCAARERLRLQGPVVISLRSLELVYDLETLVRAAPLVLRETPEAQFLIMGDGSQASELRALATQLDVGNRVRFLGVVPNADLPSYLRASDVYVSTALSDGGLAISTAEAMACGLPVVVSDAGENRAWVNEGAGGYVVPPSEPAALASKINWLLRHEEARRTFGQANREVIAKRMNQRVEMAKMMRLYEGLVRS